MSTNGRARQPAVKLVEQRRLALESADGFKILRRQKFFERGCRRIPCGPRRAAEARLDLAELHALEARRRAEDVPEIEEVERRHRFQQVDLAHEVAQDAIDAHQPRRHHAHVLVVHGLAAENRLHAVQLEQHLLEPELVCLVHDHEQHLVVRRAHGLLRVQEFRQAKVGFVVGVFGLFRHARFS